jgi:integrase
MAGLVRRRGPSWQALLSYRDSETGRTRQLSVTKPTKKEAERALAELVLARDRTAQTADGNQRFRDLVAAWVLYKQRTTEQSTMLRYDSALRIHLLPTFGAMRLRAITAARIDAWYHQQQTEGLAANSIRQHHDLLSNIFRYAVRTLKWINANPVVDANPPRRALAQVQLPDSADLARLIEAADDDGALFGAFIRVAICTGARRGELCALQWKHVDLERGRVAFASAVARGTDGYYVKAPKSRRTRTIALPSAMVEHLAMYRSYRALVAEQVGAPFDVDCFLFDCDPAGRRIGHPGTISEKYQTAKRVAGIKTVRLHDLRHHAATVLLNHHVSPRIVAERLGHTRVSTTVDIYAQYVASADEEAAEIMGGFLPGREADAAPS